MKTGKHNALSKFTNEQSLLACRKDLLQGLQSLEKLLYILTEKDDLPVAFATNTLYVLERNGLGERSIYEKVLLPTLRKKAEYLHAEGVAQAVWALSNAEIYDTEIWGHLKKHLVNKDYQTIFVKNERWSAQYFMTLNGKEHFFESEINNFSDKLFFQDGVNLFELYNGLVKAHAQNKELGLEDSIRQIEDKYKEVLRSNEQFKNIEKSFLDEHARISDEYSKLSPKQINNL